MPQVPGIREGARCVRELKGWSGIHLGALPNLCPPLPLGVSAFPLAPELSALFLTNTFLQTESTLPMDSWSKNPETEGSAHVSP